MAQPPLWLPPRGPRAPPAPQLFQPFLLPETFFPQGSANLRRLPGQEQPFPAGWAPPVGVAPLAPQAPPAGLQRAPCGCYFDPRVFHMEWTTTTLPPPATATLAQGATSLPGAAWWGFGTPLAWAAPGTPQGPMPLLLPYNHQGGAVAPAPTVLPTSIPGHQDVEGQLAQLNISGTATPAGAPPGTNIPPGSDVPPSPYDAPHSQAPGDPAGDFAMSEEVPLEEALRHFGCSLDMVGVSQDSPGSGPMPGDSSGTSAAVPHCNFTSLSLPEELLTPDYSVPEIINAIPSLEEFNGIGMEPQEPWGGDLPPSQPAMAEE